MLARAKITAILLGALAMGCTDQPLEAQSQLGCATGQQECNGSCVDTTSNSANCGTCGNACAAGSSCVSGQCQCQAGLGDCDGACVDLAADPTHCGACGNVCAAGQQCQAGACTCLAGLTDCAGSCVVVESDATNCGGCGVVCAPTEVCSAGQCSASCASGLQQCGSSCVDVATSPFDCGGCGVQCPVGQSCSAGSCGCTAAQVVCNDQCVDLSSNVQNCGACGVPCAGGQTCTQGVCACPGGQELCAGSCLDTLTDPNNCGACAVQCPVGATCQSGACNEAGSTTTGATGSGGSTTTDTTTSSGGASSTTGASTTTGAGGVSTTSTTSTTGTGGSTTSTTGSPVADFPFWLGADISTVQEQETGYNFQDTDGTTKDVFEVLKNHGFNFIRLRTFVDPMAPYGYASSANGCAGRDEAYGDLDHVIAFAQRVKAAGMGFWLTFHYSDNWADPGKQLIPEAWRGASSIDQLAALMKAYTIDSLNATIAAGVRPDIVAVGNELSSGMLMDLPGPDTGCSGENPEPSPVNGRWDNWDDLATLIIAGVEGVREVDPTLKVVLHLIHANDLGAAEWWLENAYSRGVEFDVLAMTAYPVYDGEDPSAWENTFNSLAQTYPDLEFIVAEYNAEKTALNLMMKNLPNGRGLGTFFWEPTLSGDWGDAMFTLNGTTWVADANDFAEYDALLPQLGL